MLSPTHATPAPAPKQHAAQLARLDRQIEQVERLRREGVLDGPVATAAASKARSEREALLSSADRREVKKIDRVVKMLPKAAEEYRKTVTEMSTSLKDPRLIHRARTALRELLGDTIHLSPAPSGDHLIAEMTLNSISLFRATGTGIMNGSGGPLVTVLGTEVRVLVKDGSIQVCI